MFQTTNQLYISHFPKKKTKQHSNRYPKMPRLPKISNCNSASKAGTLEICDKTSAGKKKGISWSPWRRVLHTQPCVLWFSSNSTSYTMFSQMFTGIFPPIGRIKQFEHSLTFRMPSAPVAEHVPKILSLCKYDHTYMAQKHWVASCQANMCVKTRDHQN